MTHSLKPDSISTIGFSHAPTTKLLMLATGVSSLTIQLLSSRYQELSILSWRHIFHKHQPGLFSAAVIIIRKSSIPTSNAFQETCFTHGFDLHNVLLWSEWAYSGVTFWRFLTSQFAIESSITDMISSCFLTYNFLVLERRWGSAKYISFLFSSWSLSLSMYFVIYKSKLLAHYFPEIAIVPSGPYGPLFAMLVYYTMDVAQNEEHSRLGLPITNKMFIYLIMLQMVISIDRPEKALISFCGIMAGVLHRMNFLNVQKFQFPSWIRNTTKSLLTSIGLIDPSDNEVSKKAFMGATQPVHDDMVYDYIMRRQQQQSMHNNGRFQIPANGTDNRAQIGQGFAEVMNPSFADMMRGMAEQPPVHQPPVQQPPVQQPPVQQPPVQQPPPPPPSPPPATLEDDGRARLETESVPEGKVQTLVDMGFDRDAVLNALASTGNDVQQATSILLSAAN